MSEQIAAIIPTVRKPKSFGRSDTYTLIVTDSRMIFAEMTGDMTKEAAMEAQRRGKEEGKGFFSRWGDQIKDTMRFADRYWEIPPDEALAENSKNFAIPNSSVKKIKVWSREEFNRPDEPARDFTELKIESSSGKYEFRVDGHNPKPIRESLQKVFGGIVSK